MPPFVALNQMVSATWITQSIYVAAELGIADLVKDGPRTAADLAAATSTHAESLGRVLRALASVGIFHETENGFEQTPISAFLASGHGSMRGWARWGGLPLRWDFLGTLLDTVKTGEDSFRRVHKKNPFEHMATVPGAFEVFNDAMTSFSGAEMSAILEAYDFSGIGTLADVGGGHGVLLTTILKKYPGMQGILCDLGHVIENANLSGVETCCRKEPANFFEAIPSGADAYMMKHILHDWNDERSGAILRNIRQAIPTGGKLLVLEFVVGGPNDPDFAKLLDIEMLLIGGKERTEAEFAALFQSSGFKLTRIVRTQGPVAVVEGVAV